MSKMNRNFNVCFLLICLYLTKLPLSYADLTSPQLEVLPLIKVLNGFQPETDIGRILFQINKFSSVSDHILSMPFDQNQNCQTYFDTTERLTIEIIDKFHLALTIRNIPIQKSYIQVRLEILADLFYKLGALAANGAEGGITPFIHHKSKCISDQEQRTQWIKYIEFAQIEMQKTLKLLFGTRNFKTTFNLSNFLAKEKLRRTDKEWDHFLLTTGASVVIFPFAVKYLTLSFGKSVVGIASTLISGYFGIKYGESFFSTSPEITLEIHKKIFTQIDKFIDIKLESPDLYFPFILKFEQDMNLFFKNILNQYKEQYRTGLSSCFNDGSSQNCHTEWYKFL